MVKNIIVKNFIKNKLNIWNILLLKVYMCNKMIYEHVNTYSCIERKDGRMSINRFNADSCNCNVIHEDIITKVKKQCLQIKNYMTSWFFVFGDTTRIKIIYALLKEEMCVCDISKLLGMNQSAISHQLRVLRQARIVKFRKEGRVVYYSLDDEHVRNIFEQGLIHINHK